MIKINLLSEGKRPAAVRRTKAAKGAPSLNLGSWLFAGALALILGGFGAFYLFKYLELKRVEEQVAEAQKEVDELKPIIEEVERFKRKKAELDHKIQVIKDLKRNQRGPVQVLDQVSRALPELLWLDSLEMNKNRVELKGRAFNNSAVEALITSLDNVPEFDEPELVETKRDGQVYRFGIKFNFQPSVPPAADSATADATTAAPAGTGGAAEPATKSSGS